MTNQEMIERIQAVFPKFSKSTLSMVNHEEKYGIRLSPKAKRLISGSTTKQPNDRLPPSRKQLTIRIDNQTYNSLVNLTKLCGCETLNELVDDILQARVEDVNNQLNNPEEWREQNE